MLTLLYGNIALAATLFYGSLALAALWATWKDADLVWIGLWLVAGCAVSNVLFQTVSILDRPGPYTFIEVMVAVASVIAWTNLRYGALIAVVAVNLLSIGFNIVFAANFPPSPHQQDLWVLATNLCFAAECLIVFGVGVANGYRSGRFTRRLHLRRHAPAPDAVRKDRP